MLSRSYGAVVVQLAHQVLVARAHDRRTVEVSRREALLVQGRYWLIHERRRQDVLLLMSEIPAEAFIGGVISGLRHYLLNRRLLYFETDVGFLGWSILGLVTGLNLDCLLLVLEVNDEGLLVPRGLDVVDGGRVLDIHGEELTAAHTALVFSLLNIQVGK